MQGHADDAVVKKALREAAAVAHSHKVLGSYPRAGGPARVVREGERDGSAAGEERDASLRDGGRG